MRLFLNAEEVRRLDAYPGLQQRVETLESTVHTQEDVKVNLTQMYILAVGCHKHPSYRGHKKPSSGCSTCSLMLKAGDYLRGQGFLLLKAQKPGKKVKV